MRVLLHEHKIDVVSSELVSKAIAECDGAECGNRLCVFVGHFLSFIANLVTSPPAESKMSQSILLLFLDNARLVEYILLGFCENNPDSDYEKNFLNSVIHVPMMVLLYNSVCNSAELRQTLTAHKNGMLLVRFIFESICKHR